jgi:thiamine biosynthesis protein ThiS
VTLWVNGAQRESLAAATVGELVAELGLQPRAVLVERNGVALRNDEWGAALNAGDRIEIVRIVAGG